ncbi:MAG: hypothetical protein M3454_11360 [Actinomycetota bacterium]|nr:hypothetical protein [Actinomycetota bacterium]
MATTPTGVSRLQALEAILLNPELYRLAEEIPFPDRERGGRTRPAGWRPAGDRRRRSPTATD